MKILMLLVCLVIGETIGARLKRLVGGYPLNITDVPYQVSIRFGNYHICGGSLISKRHVLTAAHCVANLFDEPYDEIGVVIGTNSLKHGGTRHNVSCITWHPEFANNVNSTWINDIAVITLAANVKENKMQRVIQLPTGNPPINATGITSGFGRTDMKNPYLSTILHALETRILPSSGCQRFITNYTIRKTMICGLQKNFTGISNGDSGGPLVWNGTIVGVASWNFPDGRGIPDVYTNVYSYLDFINGVTKVSSFLRKKLLRVPLKNKFMKI